MSSPVGSPGADEALNLLGRFQQTVADFAKREDQARRTINTRRSDASRKYHGGISRLEAQLEADLAAADAEFSEAQERVRSAHDRRRIRVRKAGENVMRSLQARGKQARERFLHQLQMRHLSAERELPGRFQAVDHAYAEFTHRLAAETERLMLLRRRTKQARRMQAAAETRPTPELPTDAEECLVRLGELLSALDAANTAFHRTAAARQLRWIPLALLLVVVMAGVGAALALRQPWEIVAGAGSGAAFIVIALHILARRRAKSAAAAVRGLYEEAALVHDACRATADAQYAADRQAVQDDYDGTVAEIDARWAEADALKAQVAMEGREKLDRQLPRALAKSEESLTAELHRAERVHAERLEAAKARVEEERAQLEVNRDRAVGDVAELDATLAADLTRAWQEEVLPLWEEIQRLNEAAVGGSPEWSRQLVESWSPSETFIPAIQIGQVRVDLYSPGVGLPVDPRFALPDPPTISVPLSLSFPERGSLVLETSDSGDAEVIGAMHNVVLRLLAGMPPGKLSLTLIDPVGLGKNFAGFMNLADYEESLINRRIWTQREQIEERLAFLNEHIEKMIQMYLRDEYATITEYNAQAGSVAEKYHLLVIADFPANFSDVAVKRLQSIAASGARCGVFVLMHWDRRQVAPESLVADELRKNSICLRREGGEWKVSGSREKGLAKLSLDGPPEPALAAEMIHHVGRSSVDSQRVELPFEQIAPAADEFWTGDTSSELRVAIGRTGATKLQYLAIGKGTRQHALFAGKTGSGKSTLFHVLITNLALAYSPAEVEFYLIDFKKGVEFKCYATKRLPHARVVAIESDREFALSVLQRVDEELKRRGDIFRKLGVQDMAGYRRRGGTDAIPRTLLIIDEFQEFFVEDDAIAQSAALLFDRIIRQGRAFGIHVLLGSQTLGGAYTLARATLGQMVIRVALQCNEADAYLIMDDNNSAPRLLSRPGEGIYNDAAGAVEGNSPFQAGWLSDEERDCWLDKISALAMERNGTHASPIVFEGNAPADVRENDLLRAALASEPLIPPAIARCWLGAPNSIKGPTQVAFHRQSGNHLLIIGQRDEEILTMLGLSMLGLAGQYPVGKAKFYFLHALTPGTPDAEALNRLLAPVPGLIIVQTHEISEVMSALAADLAQRAEGTASADAPPVFFFVHGLHRFKKLRQEEDFSFSLSSESEAGAGANLLKLINEGSSYGMHLVVTVDTLNNLHRALGRKPLGEFEMRVLFQMSANDSATLIDSPKASSLGLHRALLYNEQHGAVETFRPYALPSHEWVQEAAARLITIPV